MKRKNREIGAGSLDMLLDTMCNTFGGVCFIALLVAILSAMLPKDAGAAEEDVKKLAEDERLSQVVRTRDELKVAVETQKELLSQYGTNGLSTVTAADIVKSMKDKDSELKKLEARRSDLQDELAQLVTAEDINRKEYERLKKLEDKLKRKIADFKDARKRVVRTPVEREDFRLRAIDFWIKDGRFRVLKDTSQVSCRTEGFGESTKWFYTCRPGTGWQLTDAFLSSPEYLGAIQELSNQRYARIWVDSKSFSEVCRFRDDLIRRGCQYNWHPTDDETMVFVVGVDAHVQ